MSSLPDGWEKAKLGDVCNMIKRGIAPKYIDEGGISVINQKCIRDHKINIGLSRRHDIENKYVNPERYVQVGDVLVNSTGTGTLGRVAQVRSNPNEVVTVDTHVTIVRPKSKMFHLDFFGYMLVKIEDEITSSGEGTSGQTELAIKSLETKFDVIYPISLSEQKRIVSILDDAFEGIDQAIANTEKNLVNARELFNSYLNNVFTQKGDGWEETTLDETCSFFNGKAHEKCIDDNGKYIVVNSKFISSDGCLWKKTNSQLFPLLKNDIVFVMSDVPKGKALAKCFVIDEEDKYSLNQRICCIRSDKFTTKYLYYHLNRHKYLLSFDNKENQTNLRKGDILKCPLWLPTIEEQIRITDQLDDVTYKAKQLQSTYQQKLNSLKELKQSILQKAFTGELTADSIQ